VLMNWFILVDKGPERVTGMWVVEPETIAGWTPLQIIHLEAIARGSYLLPEFGEGFLEEGFSFIDTLDAFKTFYVNSYIDHHAHHFLRT
jgi:hypothetical protein